MSLNKRERETKRWGLNFKVQTSHVRFFHWIAWGECFPTADRMFYQDIRMCLWNVFLSLLVNQSRIVSNKKSQWMCVLNVPYSFLNTQTWVLQRCSLVCNVWLYQAMYTCVFWMFCGPPDMISVNCSIHRKFWMLLWSKEQPVIRLVHLSFFFYLEFG